MRIRNSDSRFVHVINEYLYCVQTLCHARCQRLHGQPCLRELCWPVGKTDMIRQVTQRDHENGDRGYEGGAPGGLGLDLLGVQNRAVGSPEEVIFDLRFPE